MYVGSQRGTFYALALADGAERWHFATQGHGLKSANFGFDRTSIQSSPAVSGGAVYFGARDGLLYALDRATGRLRWQFDHHVSWVNSSPAVADGLVFAASSDAQFAQGVDTASGEERWRAADISLMWASPTVAGDAVIIGAADGVLRAFDRASGSRLWEYRLGGGIFSSATVAGGRVYVGADDGNVYALAQGPAPVRAVFWDSTLLNQTWFGANREVRDALVDFGYQPLDQAALARFLTERVVDRRPSVVVFANDVLPASVAPVAADTVLFRRYLDAGGKVVWLGVPPMVFPRRPDGSASLEDVNRDAGRALLGVDFSPGNFDDVGATATESGRRWGLGTWWVSRWSAAANSVTTILARDDRGNASSWIKSYGGARGSGFVRLFGADLGRAASHGPWRATQAWRVYLAASAAAIDRSAPFLEEHLKPQPHQSRRAVGKYGLIEIPGRHEVEREEFVGSGHVSIVVQVGPRPVPWRFVRDRLGMGAVGRVGLGL